MKFKRSHLNIYRKFYLELYSSDIHLPSSRLVEYTAYEEHSTPFFKTNSYRLFYLKSPRKWQRLTVSITLSRASIYWELLKQASKEALEGFESLPDGIYRNIESLVSEFKDLEDDNHLNFILQNEGKLQRQGPDQKIGQVTPPSSHHPPGLEILTLLDDLGCPRFVEDEVIQVGLLRASSMFAFVSCLHGKTLWDYRFFPLSPISTRDLYRIQPLHSVSGASRVAKFIGIIVDANHKKLKGYLCEMQAKGTIFNEIRMAKMQGKRISWERREKWAREIIEGVSQVHSKSFVIGSWLAKTASSCLAIDSTDSVFLQRFHYNITDDCAGSGEGYLPPEYRCLPFYPGMTLAATPKTDIFHLGIVLWCLAESMVLQNSRLFCEKARCPRALGAPCLQPHADPIALPPLSDDIPQYYKDIVTSCRVDDPNSRPPAWRLLAKFPPAITPGIAFPNLRIERGLNLEVVADEHPHQIYCDGCSSETHQRFFHCNICRSANFDICPPCLAQGLHCEDSGHFLVETVWRRVRFEATHNFYSCVKEKGERDILHL